MIYEMIKSKVCKDFVLCSFWVLQKCFNVCDFYFKVIFGESMIVYEFIMSQVQICLFMRIFVVKFVFFVFKYGVQDVFVFIVLFICL